MTMTSNHSIRPIPRSVLAPGLTFSRLVYGAWRLRDDPAGCSASEVIAKISTCLDLGITTFDHADIYGDYGCEAVFGTALADLGSRIRTGLELVSKCGIKLRSAVHPQHRWNSYDTSRAHIVSSVDNSLRNLRTDYLDLLLLHRPDPLLALDEVGEAFASLHKQGKVRAFGVSNCTPSQLDLVAACTPTPLVTNQIEFGPLHLPPLTDGSLDQCQMRQMRPMAWSPFAGGRLMTGKGERETRLRAMLQTVGDELGSASMEQVVIAWILRHPAQILPIIGTNSLERIRQLAKATALTLSREQWHGIWSASMGTPVP